MNNFKKVLLSTAIVSLITVNAVDARACMSSGFQVGFGVNVSKKKAEIKNNKNSVVSDKVKASLNDKLTKAIAEYKAKLASSDSLKFESKIDKIKEAAVDATTGNIGALAEATAQQNYATFWGLQVYVPVKVQVHSDSGQKYGWEELSESENIVARKVVEQEIDFDDYLKDTVVPGAGDQKIIAEIGSDRMVVYCDLTKTPAEFLKGSKAIEVNSMFNTMNKEIPLNECPDKGEVDYDGFLSRLGLSEMKSRIGTTLGDSLKNSITTRNIGNIIDKSQQKELIKIKNELLSEYLNAENEKINSVSPAFSKSNVGKEFEAASHFGFDISLSAGYFWRIGDFAIYIGALGKIPVAKKVYNIKDKALADLQSNTSNSSNSNNSNKDTENTDYCFTYESKASFGGEIAGYYNLTTNFAMGLGCVVLYQRGELKYNKLNTVYSVEEKSDLANICNLLGVKLDDINSEWKKIGFDSDSKKIHNWSFTPQILALVNFGNFAIKFGAGYNFGTKLLKSDKNNMDLSLKGFEFNVGLTYTFAV